MPSVLDREWWMTRHDSVIERGPESISMRTAAALYDAGSVTFHFKDGIVHRSGIQAPIYINVRKAFGNPESRQTLSGLLREFAEVAGFVKPDVVVGVASGGQAPAQELANQLFLPFGFVRKEAKEHGEKKQVEGCEVDGRRTLVVEDVVNLGTSSLPAVEAVRKEGGIVSEVLAIVTYGYSKTIDQFQEAGLSLKTLTTIPDIVKVGVARGALDESSAKDILDWLREQDSKNSHVG